MTKLITILFSISAATFAAAAGKNIADYASEQTAVVQEYLSREPELTETVLEAAVDYAHKLVELPFFGIAYGILAGVAGGMALYTASKKEENYRG